MTSMRRALHLTEKPDDTRALREQLAAEGLTGNLEHVGGPKALGDAIRADTDLIVADLPLPWPHAEEALAEFQRLHPDVPVVFRSSRAGEWQVEASRTRMGTAIRDALEHRPLLGTDEQAHRLLLDQIVRQQGVLVHLAELDFWDFEASLRETVKQVADLLDVERVSVWEFDEDDKALIDLALYRRSLRTFTRGERIVGRPNYMRALKQSMSLASNDARRDPRTSEYADDYLIPLGITSLLDAPIRRGGRVTGVLCLLCFEHVGPQRIWTLLDQCTAGSAASLLARGLETRDRRQAEEHLQRAQRGEAMGRFAGQLAHDFHNRLTVISLLTDLLRSDSQTPVAREHIAQLEQELEQARRQIRELLQLGRRTAAEPHPTELNDAVDALAPTLARVLGTEHELRTIRYGEPLWVDLDPAQLNEVLTNLITNARDAMAGQEPGFVTIRLTMAADHRRPAALLSVEDSGQGFSEEAEAHLFEPFFTTKAPGKGSGLGLASVHSVALQHGGTVRVKRVVPHGSRVEVVLPLLGDSAPTTARG
jgi:two-component system, cell cycle sensor histidine kinase and response regulator CckA